MKMRRDRGPVHIVVRYDYDEHENVAAYWDLKDAEKRRDELQRVREAGQPNWRYDIETCDVQ